MLNQTFCSSWYKEEIKENNAWLIYAIGVNFGEGIFMHDKVCKFVKKETLSQVNPSEFCEISKNTFFMEQPWATTSVNIKAYFLSLSFNCLLSTVFYLSTTHLDRKE